MEYSPTVLVGKVSIEELVSDSKIVVETNGVILLGVLKIVLSSKLEVVVRSFCISLVVVEVMIVGESTLGFVVVKLAEVSSVET